MSRLHSPLYDARFWKFEEPERMTSAFIRLLGGVNGLVGCMEDGAF